ncbi:hypothetical protein L9F63_019886, partial [Diploptera punctata]
FARFLAKDTRMKYDVFKGYIITYLRNTVYDDVCVARLFQIPLLRVYRKHYRNLQGPTSWIKHASYAARFETTSSPRQ